MSDTPEEEEKPHVVARDHRSTGVGQGVDLRRRTTAKLLPAAKQEAFALGLGAASRWRPAQTTL